LQRNRPAGDSQVPMAGWRIFAGRLRRAVLFKRLVMGSFADGGTVAGFSGALAAPAFSRPRRRTSGGVDSGIGLKN